MSDWMSGPHRAQRTVDLEVTADPEPAELTEPVDVIAWLRALPVGTVLLDQRRVAWQVGRTRPGTCLMRVNSGYAYVCSDGQDMADACHDAPFRVLWMPGGAT